VDDFVDTLKRLVRGGSVVDPALVAELVTARHADDQLNVLSPREREVLALMAEGRSNSGIARKLWVTEGTVEKHIGSIMTKLHLPETDDTHRRVLAVLAFLNALLAVERALARRAVAGRAEARSSGPQRAAAGCDPPIARLSAGSQARRTRSSGPHSHPQRPTRS